MSNALLFHGGRVFAGRGRLADWLLVDGGRVESVGSGAPPAVEGAESIDLAGRLLAPGFCDAHVHLTWLATALLGVDLSACGGAAAILEAVASYRGPRRGPEGDWIVGFGFDDSTWDDPRLPCRAELDAVSGPTPVLLQRVCGHVGVVNSAALVRLSAGPFTDVESGRLSEDDLYAANDLVRPGAAELEAALSGVQATLHAHGVTSVHDVLSPDMLAALVAFSRAGKLAARVSGSIPSRYLQEPERGSAAARGLESGEVRDPSRFFAAHGLASLPLASGEAVHVLGIKLFLDGSLGARTAALRAPYSDAPGRRGALLLSGEELDRWVRRVHAARLQLMVHAIGDEAVLQGLAALAPVLAEGNPRRHRLEHVEVTPPDLVERLARSGAVACVQPNFAGRWSQPGGLNEQRLGARLAHCNAYRTLHEAGVPLAFGSDCMPFGPLAGLRGAVAHPLPGERLDPRTALELYTTAGADLSGAAWGRIQPGAPADLVLLAADPRSPWEALRVEGTWFSGRRVFPGVEAP